MKEQLYSVFHESENRKFLHTACKRHVTSKTMCWGGSVNAGNMHDSVAFAYTLG